jgi:dynein heavy chain
VPIIFVLTQGVDPTELLYKFAEEKGVAVSSISLGKGQSQKAIDFLKNGAKDGVWCFLSNCHLSVSLLPDLEATLEQILVNGEFQDSFRLFLSAKPVPQFPISLLQKSLKMT